MNSSFFYKTQNRNNYLYDFNRKILLLIHPLLRMTHQDKLVECGDEIDVEKFTYYKNKIEFLRKNGWFSSYDSKHNVKARLNPQDIYKQLANTEQLTFEVTDKCNLDCTYCGYGRLYSNYDERLHSNLSFSKAILIIDYLFNLWNSDLNISKNKTIFIGFYGGEPLLNIDLIKSIVKYINAKTITHCKIRYSMTTNSVLLHKHLQFLVENDFELLISLDGDKWGNSYRLDKNKNSSFERILKNLEELQDKYPEFFKKNVNFNAVLHNRNSIDALYVFFKKKFNKKPMISELSTIGITPDKRLEFNRLFQQTEKSILASNKPKELINELFNSIPFFKDLSRFIHLYTYQSYKSYKDFYRDHRSEIHTPTGTCMPFSKKIFITVNGSVFPCETIGHQFSLGKIQKDEIFLNATEITDYYNSLYDSIRKDCDTCYYQQSCVQCIFNMHFENDSPTCTSKMNRTDFKKYLSEKTIILENNPTYYPRIINRNY